MFQPQPTPFAGFYGMASDLPGYTYNQQQHQQQQQHLISSVYPDGVQGGGVAVAARQQGQGLQQQQQVQGRVGGGVAGGSYGGPRGGQPIAFGGVATSGAEATCLTLAAGGPAAPGLPLTVPLPAAPALLFTSPVFNNHVNVHNTLNNAGSALFYPSFGASSTTQKHPRRYPDQRIRTNIRSSVDSRHRRHPNIKMESDQDVSADLAAQEAAAREYQPHLEGPLVGDRTPSDVISEAYAQADPIYVQKTLALPQTYSHYRPVQGDGNCGWRSIGFGYFESLIRSGDASLLCAERDRIIQYPILNHPEMVYEDMREEVGILMNDIAACLPDQPAAMRVLLHKFNDLDVANHILYYLRLLASSWLKSGDPTANDLISFIPDGIGIQGYCDNYLELPGREIEHLGIVTLYNMLLKPCGMVIEIAYLDRTPGSEVTTYRIPDEATGQDSSTVGPIIYLLFRPDHYDILYPHPPAPPPAPLDIQVHRVSSFSHQHQITSNIQDLQRFSEVDMSALALIPGLSLSGSGMPAIGMQSAPSIDSYSPSPQSPWMPSPFSEPLPIRQQHQPQQLKQEQSAPVLRAVSAAPQPVTAQPATVRFSEYCHPAVVENESWQDQHFTTSTFKNSHYNKAHYNNPNFQPEEYRPEEDEANYEVVKRPVRVRKSH